MARVAITLTFLLFVSSVPSRVWAQYDGSYDNGDQSRVWLRALLDVRVAGGGPAASWTDRGQGQLRYGGSSNAT